MTDETEQMPERIFWNGVDFTSSVPFAGGVEYVRGDLFNAKDARIAELEAKVARYEVALKSIADDGASCIENSFFIVALEGD